MAQKNSISISRKTFMAIGIAMLLITIGAIYVLSSSINKSNEDTYKYITSKNFYQKLRSLEQEFAKIDNHLYSLEYITKNTPLDQLSIKYEVLNDMYNLDGVVSLNWYFKVNANNEILETYIGKDKQHDTENIFTKTVLANPLHSKKNTFIEHNGFQYWLMYHSISLPNNERLIYGIVVDMALYHKYLTNIDVTTPNYAYIFTKDGLCIYHPENSLMGKNVFELSNFSAKDTINTTDASNPPVVNSEYLNLEVFRFISPFKSENFSGYITVNFPKFNVDDNIKPIRRNTILIFITTVTLLVSLFYIFNIANKKAYLEKELLAVENEKIIKEKALIQLQQLKNQINPHFLFNSLNSLYMLIDLEPNTAQKFTLNLSKTYRYLITPPEENIVNIDNEVEFINKYIALQKTRFTQELHFELNDNRSEKSVTKIPFLGLQICVENALKHNIATIEHPLSISIDITDENVIISNNYQPKKSEIESEHFGVKYLESIYNYYNTIGFMTFCDEGKYICILPLIKC
ncbi:histidine kinase [Myroides marinus]|uniref:histidine kinase n=2 Tax=Myroides marinus TaxID=703342 RepID=UPI0025757030|nr:histidine kinase [Myroides marinus]